MSIHAANDLAEAVRLFPCPKPCLHLLMPTERWHEIPDAYLAKLAASKRARLEFMNAHPLLGRC